MHLGKILTHIGIAAITTIATVIPLQATELGPEVVLKAVYAGLRQVDGTRANPRVRWNVRNGTSTPCARVSGSMYCPRNNTIYITGQHIRFAYEYGDAALAYILSHEYAHAVQTAGRFMPRSITAAELQADCLAGYFMGTMPNVNFDLEDIKQIATVAHEIGDYEFNNADHHGTPEQRTRAVLTGIQASQKQNVSACRVR